MTSPRLWNRPAMEARNYDAIRCAIGIVTLLTAASAQELKAIKTVKVTQSLNDIALYEVKDDGTVLIDWDKVEALAASKQNPLLLSQAQVMLAIRDGKWKAMDQTS